MASFGWSRDIVRILAETSVRQALLQLGGSRAAWVVVMRDGLTWVYALSRNELLNRTAALSDLSMSLEQALGLREDFASLRTRADPLPVALPMPQAQPHELPSRLRAVAVDAAGQPVAVGGADVQPPVRRKRGLGSPPPPPPPTVTLPQEPEQQIQTQPSAAPAGIALPAPGDEGTLPRRFPSIEPFGSWAAGEPIALDVDLLRQPAAATIGGAVDFGALPVDWQTITLQVTLICPDIEFDHGGRGDVTVWRNAASLPARITGRVRTAAAATLVIQALFMHGSRYAGVALRTLAASAAAPAPPPTVPATVVVDPAAAGPDLAVSIFRIGAAGRELLWLLKPAAGVLGLPAALDGTVRLQCKNPDAESAALFAEFAQLPEGQHETVLHGFGDRLWKIAPDCFRETYWAIWDHFKRPLTIQFTTDEPNLPWELMRPSRKQGRRSEIQPPLALQHAVARWLRSYAGWMPNRLPQGRLCTIAPRGRPGRKLTSAQTESQRLQQHYGAEPVAGTRDAVRALLESAPHAPDRPVAVLHFAGHGRFNAAAADLSAIELEDGELSVAEAGMQEVQLGAACRTLVVFNACEVGATGVALGQVGGWADALLRREFGGFIAPLWAVEDQDASVVIDELIAGIVTDRRPVGEVLRDIRKKHGSNSPTFYSYLYYGDVTAYMG